MNTFYFATEEFGGLANNGGKDKNFPKYVENIWLAFEYLITYINTQYVEQNTVNSDQINVQIVPTMVFKGEFEFNTQIYGHVTIMGYGLNTVIK